MPAVSKAQQKFFGIVRAIQKGEMAPTTPETAKAAADMKKKDVKDFASTKHKGLPDKKVAKEAKLDPKVRKDMDDFFRKIFNAKIPHELKEGKSFKEFLENI